MPGFWQKLRDQWKARRARPPLAPAQPLNELPPSRESLEALVRDRTQQLQAAVARLEQEVAERQRVEIDRAQLIEILELTSDLVAMARPDGRLTYLNRAGRRLLGWPETGPLENKYIHEAHPAWAYAIVQTEGIPAALRAGSWTGETVLLHAPTGREISVSQVIVVHRLPTGEVDYMATMIRDITERKLAEGKLRLAQVQQKALLDNLPFQAWMKDAGGYFLAVNEPLAQACGRPVAAIIGKTDMDVWPYALAEKYRAADREVLLRRRKKLVEEPLTEAANSQWLEIYRAPVLDDAGQVIGTVGLARDITERKQTEAEIRRLTENLEQRVRDRTAQLKTSNKELEAFAYSVSHDLRAPLRSIDGYSQALLEDNAAQLDEVGQEHLRHIRAASQRMGKLIDDLLELSRLTRCELTRQTVDLSALARGVAESLAHEAAERPVEWVIAEEVTAPADESLVRVVLENLLGNAWKFTARCTPARIEFGVQPQPDGPPAYYVRDNGAGFDMTYADKLFGVFQRLHTVREFPGTGIGLASVQRIIHRHGGRVWAEGAVNQGATFYFTLPG